MKKVKYIPKLTSYAYTTLTAGKTYTVESQHTRGKYNILFYEVQNDHGVFHLYVADSFEDVEDVKHQTKLDREIAVLEGKLNDIHDHLIKLSDAIGEDSNFTRGMIQLDEDYQWSIVQCESGANILVCKYK
jgi:hypothetical protein